MKLLEMEKRYEDKAECLLSPPTKYGRTFFVNKHGTNVFGQIYEGMFYMENDQIMQGGS